ncbi:MAG: ThiJ/PfpI domain protein [Rhodocyclales bacterium]|nr:ThiJ/PfpI domain protein [Rhodocyclales bacterium]
MTTPFPIVFPIFPDVTQLDFTGPHEVLSKLPGAQCVLGSPEGGPVQADGGLRFDTQRLADIERCAVLCVPGGYGVTPMMQHTGFLAELRRLAATAQFVTSVCSGSLLLAAAGLLHGKRAACHWAWRDLLGEFDNVTPDPARVVRDGNIFTGGGVTAGIDMALTLMAEIAGDNHAQAVLLGMEYAAAPPFAGGRPELAPPAIVAMVQKRFDSISGDRQHAARCAAQALRASSSSSA